MASPLPDVLVRQVWQSNFTEEMELIQRCSAEFRFASIDTDPATVFRLDAPKHVIQLGLTLSDSSGNLPRFGSSEFKHVWQFNFHDIDSESDLCDPNSISLRNLLRFNRMLSGLTCTF